MTTTDQKSAAAARRAAAADQQRDELRTALAEERRGYVQRGLSERVEAVDAQLAQFDTTPKTKKAPDQDKAPDPTGNPPVNKAGRRGRGTPAKGATAPDGQSKETTPANGETAGEGAPAATGTEATDPQNPTGDQPAGTEGQAS